MLDDRRSVDPVLVLSLCGPRFSCLKVAYTDYAPAGRASKLRSARAEIGVVLTGLGFVFSFLGIVFFFDRGLIALGNVRPRLHLHGPVLQLSLQGSLTTGLTPCMCVAADVLGGRVAHHWASGDAALLYEEEKPEGAYHSMWCSCRTLTAQLGTGRAVVLRSSAQRHRRCLDLLTWGLKLATLDALAHPCCRPPWA